MKRRNFLASLPLLLEFFDVSCKGQKRVIDVNEDFFKGDHTIDSIGGYYFNHEVGYIRLKEKNQWKIQPRQNYAFLDSLILTESSDTLDGKKVFDIEKIIKK
jgi:hypothetical protein